MAASRDVAGASGTFEYGLFSDEFTDGTAVFNCLSGVYLSGGKGSRTQDNREIGEQRDERR